MEMIKKLLTYGALLAVLLGVIAYAYPLITNAGKGVTDDGINTIKQIQNATK
jgi:hypothetical protein